VKKFWRVLIFEYIRRVKTRGFLFAVISMPLLVILAMAIGLVSVRLQTNTLPVGIFDQSGIISFEIIPQETALFPSQSVEILEFKTIESGKHAVQTGDIQALFHLKADYLSTGEIEVFALEKPGENALNHMRQFLKDNLIHLESPQTIEILKKGNDFTIRSYDGSQQANMRDWFVVFFPFAVGLIFVIVINISGGYLLQSVVDEKENRTMEMVVTSVSPEQLMFGKILGNLSVGLTQLFIWLAFAVFGLTGFQVFFHYDQVPDIQPVHLVILFGIIAPGFILIAALMTLVGVMVTELREAQQVSVLFTLPMVSPFWFAAAILKNPGHPLTVFLSVFPFTAVVAMPLRASTSTVPVWQFIIASTIMWASAVIALVLAAKSFRLGMLQYGKRLSLKYILRTRQGVQTNE